MGVFAGPEAVWCAQTDVGRTHISTKGVVQSGLVLNLDAGVSSSYSGSGTSWNNLVSSGISTLTNGPTYDSSNGGYLVFDGSDDYLVTFNIPQTFTDFTLSTWFRIVSNSGGERQVFANQGDSVGMSILNNKFFVWNGTFNTSPTSALNNTWYNWVVTRTGSTLKFIINNVLDSTYTSSNSWTANNCYISAYFGSGGTAGTSRFLNSNISTFLIYDRGLSDQEISQNFNALRGRFGI